MRDECEHGSLRRKCDRCEDHAEIARLQAQVADLTRERDGLNESVEAMLERDKWPPCACSYDKPGDVCATHSPRLAAETARALAAVAVVARLRDALHQISLMEPNSMTTRAAMGRLARAVLAGRKA